MSDGTISAKLGGIIEFLEAMKADVEKFERGFDAPGVRIRKNAQQVRNDLGDLRKLVQDERSARKKDEE